MNNTQNNDDCKVCEQIVKHKHRLDFLWKVGCILLAILIVILAIGLLAKNGGVIGFQDNSTQLEQSGNDNTVEGEGGIIIGSSNSSVNQHIEQKDDNITKMVAIICGSVVILGGIGCAIYILSKKYNNNKKQRTK